MFLHSQNHFGFELVSKNFSDFAEAGFNFLANGGSYFVLPAGVFHVHERPSKKVVLLLRALHLEKLQNSECRIYCLIVLHYFLTLRWWVLGMRMSSRYFATVRRVTWMPCD